MPWGHVKSNIQSIGDVISLRMYDTYFHHDVRSHNAGATLPKCMRVDFFFFFDFPTDFSFFSFCFSLIFFFYCAFISYFCFGLACSPRQAGLLKKDKVKVNFQSSIFQGFFRHLKVSGMCLRTDATSIHGHGTGTYKEINIKRIRK